MILSYKAIIPVDGRDRTRRVELVGHRLLIVTAAGSFMVDLVDKDIFMFNIILL
jgi:hypothetical protein